MYFHLPVFAYIFHIIFYRVCVDDNDDEVRLSTIQWCHMAARVLLRDIFVNALCRWETTLQCIDVSHWLGAYTNCSLVTVPLWENMSGGFPSQRHSSAECVSISWRHNGNHLVWLGYSCCRVISEQERLTHLTKADLELYESLKKLWVTHFCRECLVFCSHFIQSTHNTLEWCHIN